MKKIISLSSAAVLAVAMATVSAIQPASALKFAYTSGIQVQNLSAANAAVAVTFYDALGAVGGTINDSITANGAKTFFPLTQVASGFNGSAIVSSDQQVAAVVNVLGDGGVAGAAYVGQSTGSANVFIPLLAKGNYGLDTWYKVQNVGSADATVSVLYSDGAIGNATIKPGAAATFNQADETHSQLVFSAKVTSNQPVVVTVIEEDPKTMFAYNGFPAGSTSPVIPLVNTNNYGTITGIQMQNLGGSDTSVTLSYTPVTGGGTACSETLNVPANQSVTFAFFAFKQDNAGEDCANGALFVGSARVTTNSTSQPLAAIINQVLPDTFGEAYGSFDASGATGTIVMPLIMDRNWGAYTGFSVMNVGSAAATVTCTFTGTPYQVSRTLQPGEALADLQRDKIGDTYVGAGTCTATEAGSKLVGVVNEASTVAGDTFYVYEAINK